ncbi:hypothetical protein L7F22_013422 [Adiantum nelumboides]|nr:hypothetical protein [Adiantum nelumboides]
MIEVAPSSVRAITRKGKERVDETEKDPTPLVATHPPTHVAVPLPDPLPKPCHVCSRPLPSKSFPPTLPFDLVSALNRVELTMSLPQYLLASPSNRALLRRYCKALGSSSGVASIVPAVQRVDSLLAERECPRVECLIHQLVIPHTIVDGGSGVNVLSYSTFTKLGLSFNGVPVTGLRMGDHRSVLAEGFIQGLPVTVAGHTVDIDCYVLRLSPGPGQYQLLLGRPWIWQTDCVIDIPRGRLLLGRGSSRMVLPAYPSSVASPRVTSEIESDGDDDRSSTSSCTPSSYCIYPDSVEITIDTEEDSTLLAREEDTVPVPIKGDDKVVLLGASLEPSLWDELISLCQEYHDIFAWDYTELKGFPPELVVHRIPLKPGALPVRQRQRRLPEHYREGVYMEIKKLLEAGLIFPVDNTEWVSPIVVVPKKNKHLRICVDYKQLNKATIKDYYPLPFIDQILDSLAGREIYAFLDCFSRYNQMAIADEDKLKTTFTTIFGTYAYHVMPFGLCNAPSSYQRYKHDCFRDDLIDFLKIFMDDIGVGTTRDAFVKSVHYVFQKCREKSIALNAKKCVFGVSYGILLGHLISSHGIAMDPKKVEALLAFPTPTTVCQVRGFLGAAKHYSRFIKDMAHLILPLNTLLRVEHKFHWGDSQQESFTSLKQAFTVAPIVKPPDVSKPFHLFFACSSSVISACIAQLYDKKMHPIAYYSRKLKDAETRYTWVERACLAIAESARKFRTYLSTQHSIIYVSKDSLRLMMNKLEPPERIMRWIVELQVFDHELKSKPPALQKLVDCLADVSSCVDEPLAPDPTLFRIEPSRECHVGWPRSPSVLIADADVDTLKKEVFDYTKELWCQAAGLFSEHMAKPIDKYKSWFEAAGEYKVREENATLRACNADLEI